MADSSLGLFQFGASVNTVIIGDDLRMP
jgi:hypothetical protein